MLLALCLCASSDAAGDEAGRPSVILISIDTLRADHLSAYGYTRIHTPHIDSFAQGGVLFSHTEAQVPLTLPSHTSLLTSTYPFENRVEENGERVPARLVTLGSVLQKRGYRTAAFIGSDFLDRRYGLDQGFDVYDSPFGIPVAPGANSAPKRAPTRPANPLALSLRRDGALVVRAARQWLEAHQGQPVFVFVHLFDLHVPYAQPPEVAARTGISRYDAQLEYVDEVMGRFQQDLVAGGWWQKSLVVVFGDHGEGLGDHQETDHGYYVYESTLHVPLLIHLPGAAGHRNSNLETGNWKLETGNSPRAAGLADPQNEQAYLGRVSSFGFRVSALNSDMARADAPVGLIDVAPTILDYLRVPIPASFEGASQLSALKGGQPAGAHSVYSESLYAYDAFGWSPLRVLRGGKYKYIQAPRPELYDLAADPGEHANLLPGNAAMGAELENQLAQVLARYAPPIRAVPAALSPETVAELESLGYLASEPRQDDAGLRAGAGLPDPKDRFAEFELYQSAYVDATEGRVTAALPKFQSILKSDPHNTLARFHLGESYLQLNEPQDALREWGTALKLDSHYAPAAEAIGQYWLTQGDYGKARRRFQQVLALTPESFTGHFQLAMADKHLGLIPEAREHLQTACNLSPHDEDCARELRALTTK